MFLSFVCLFQCKLSVVVSSSITNLCVKIGILDPSNKRNRWLENLDVAGGSSYYAPRGLSGHGDFS